MNPELAAKVAELRKLGASQSEVDAYIRMHAPQADATATDRMQPKPGRSFGDDVQGAASSVAQGATLGFGDELLALAAMATGARNFGRLREQAAQPQKDFAAAHPVADFGLQVAGGVAAGGLGGAAAKTAGFGPRVGMEVMTRGQKAARTARQVGTAMGVGGVAGAGMSEGTLEDRLKGAAAGAAFGGGLMAGGKAANATLEAVGIKPLVRNIMPRPESRASSPRLSRVITPHADLAAQDVLADVERSGLTLEEVLARAKANPDQPLYDLGPSMPQRTGSPLTRRDPKGDPLVRRARGVQSIPSRGSAEVSDFINTRAETRPAAVKDALGKGLGAERENVIELDASLKGSRAGKARPAYEAAYEGGPLDDPEVAAAFDLPQFQQAFLRGQRIAKTEGQALPAVIKMEKKGMHAVPVRDQAVMPDTRTIDYTKRGLDDLIESKMRAGKMGRAEARALRARLDQVLERVDAANPEYAEARRIFADASREIEAAELGGDFWKMSGDRLEIVWPKLSDSAKEQYRKTALAAIEERLGSGTHPSKLLNEVTLRKLRTIATSPEEAEAFEMALRRQVQGAVNDNDIVQGSQTARIMADQADLGAGNTQGLGAMMEAGTGNVGGLFQRAAQSGVVRRVQGLTEKRVDNIAPYLTAKGDVLTRKLEDLIAMRDQQARKQAAQRITSGRFAGLLGGNAGKR